MFYSFQIGYSDVIIICNNDIKEMRKVTLEFALKARYSHHQAVLPRLLICVAMW